MMKRILFACAALVAIAACGGRSGKIQLKVVTSPADDPFANAATVKVYMADMMSVKTAAVMSGKFEVEAPQKPANQGTAQVTIEALDAAGQVIAWGRTPLVLLQPVDQGPYGVWVARPHSI